MDIRHLKQQLSTDDGIVTYVEAELTRELPNTPVVWWLKSDTEVVRLPRAASTWTWRRWTQDFRWRIECTGGGIPLDYDLIVSRDPRMGAIGGARRLRSNR